MKRLMIGLMFLLISTYVLADGLGFHRAQQGQGSYTLAMHPSGFAPRIVMGVRQTSPSGPYFDPNNRGSRVNGGFTGYVPDTYSLHRPGAVLGSMYGQRMPGLPFRATSNQITYGS